MTPEYRLTQIRETISDIKIDLPVSRWLVIFLLESWPELYREAKDREGKGWINLLQAAAAQFERTQP